MFSKRTSQNSTGADKPRFSKWLASTLVIGLVGTAACAQAPVEQFSGAPVEAELTASPIEGINFQFVEANGIQFRLAQAGMDNTGPLVLMAHGWPESWYNWRHQMTFLADHGYRVVAPDMRGFGATDKPEAIEDYDVITLTEDMVGILDALGEEKAIMVGHDWGSIVASHTVLLNPDRFDALIAMSVPVRERPPVSPMDVWRERHGDNFYYILYHNEPGGVAEAEYDSDPRGLLSSLYLSPDADTEAPVITDPKRSAGGWIQRRGAAKSLPDWMNQEDLDYLVDQFESAGFRGGVNYYRNLHRNWEITEHLEGVQVHKPVLFIAGEQDIVIAGATQPQLEGAMSKIATDLRGVILFPGVGHWVQQEAADETNEAMLEFLDNL